MWFRPKTDVNLQHLGRYSLLGPPSDKTGKGNVNACEDLIGIGLPETRCLWTGSRPQKKSFWAYVGKRTRQSNNDRYRVSPDRSSHWAAGSPFSVRGLREAIHMLSAKFGGRSRGRPPPMLLFDPPQRSLMSLSSETGPHTAGGSRSHRVSAPQFTYMNHSAGE
jgi:hypothetical protein